MPINITDVDAFTDPATRPAGSDVRNSASVQGPFQALANRTRWLVGMLGGVSGAGEWSYKTSRSRVVTLPLQAGITGGSNVWSRDTSEIASASIGYRWESSANFALIYWSLNDLLRTGQTITELKAIVKPDHGRSTAQRVRVGLLKKSVNFTTPNELGAVHLAWAEDDGTGNMQVVTLNATSPPFGTGGAFPSQDHETSDFYAFVRRGDADNDFDRLYGLRITFTSFGPREG